MIISRSWSVGKIFCAVCSMSKILIKNIYYMLAYAFTNLKSEEIKNISAEEFENIHNLLAAILSEGIAKILKQGLYREYINHTENISTLRGKIEMSGTIKNFVSGRKFLRCNYDELSENNLPNQILKTAAILMLRNENVSDKNKIALKKEILFLANVEIVRIEKILREKILFTRNNQNYRMAMNICRLIFEGMILTTDSGEYKLAKFFDDKSMCRLYEKFLLAYYQKNFPQLKVSAMQIAWALDDDNKNFLPTMQSDITISDDKKILIIDAKYYSHTMQKNFDVYKIHSQNLYQIFAYVKNKSVATDKKVSGMLLYARTNEQIQPNNIFCMSGNKIFVKTLDLNKNFSEIAAQLDTIVKNNFEV